MRVQQNESAQWRVVASGRYSDYKKDNTYVQEIRVNARPGQPWTDAMLAGPASFTIPNSQGDNKFQPSIGLEFRPSDSSMYYVTYKEGFKAGGLDHQATNSNPETQRIEAEEVEAWEAGARWDLADGRGRLNLTAFHAEYTNLQVSLFDPTASGGAGAFLTGNAGGAVAKGIEADTQWALTENLTLGAYLSLLDAEYDEYVGVNCYAVPRQTEAEGCAQLFNSAGMPAGRGQDLSGTPLQFGPDISGTVTLDFTAPMGNDMEMFANLSLFFTDDYRISADGDPDLVQDGYAKLDLRAGVGAADERWQLALVGSNLTDEEIFEWAGNTPLAGNTSHFGLLKRTRQIALQGIMRLGRN